MKTTAKPLSLSSSRCRALSLFCILHSAFCIAEDTQGIVLPFKKVSVSSPVLQEVVENVLVEEGDSVTEGQVLVTLRSDREKLEVEEADKRIELLAFTAKGHQQLLTEKIGSKDAALKSGTELELAKIAREAATVRLGEKTVKSPLSGIVVKKYKENGESVDRVEKLVDIVNIDQVYVQFYLDPKMWTAVKTDQPVTVKFPVIGAGLEVRGKISFIDPQIDAGANLFRVKVLLDNKDHQIKAGMRGTADFGK
jgi:RND family efflux transporter MFP subunit